MERVVQQQNKHLATDASTSGDATSTTDTAATTEGFANLDDSTGSDWISSASGYATKYGYS